MMRNKFRPVLACALAFLLILCPAYATSFPDVEETAEYAEAVDYISEIGIMEGDNNGNFNPHATVTRAEMATVVCRLLGETENLSTTNRFPDVPASHWANAYIGKAAELGIVTGYDNGNFGPADTVTYEQALAMVIRAMEMDMLAIAMGGYPNGYLAVAEEQGYTASISSQIGDLLPRSTVAIILYNAFNF